MDTNNLIGEFLEKGKSAASTTVNQTVSDIAGSVASQVGINNVLSKSSSQAVQADHAGGSAGESVSAPIANEFTNEMVKDFYAPSVQRQPLNQSEEEMTQQRIAQVRQKILQERHNDVYFNAINSADVPKQREERPAEKAERQQMEDLHMDQKNKPSELPIAQLRGMTHIETAPGTVG